MQLPTTSYPHGYNNNRHGGSTGVKSHFLLPHPGTDSENLSLYVPYQALFRH
jgi:hypothetical protein